MLEKYKKEKKEKKNGLTRLLWVCFSLSLFFGVSFFAWSYIKGGNFFTKKNITENKTEDNNKDIIVNENSFVGDVNTADDTENNESSSSKNYKIKQIRFGGNVILSNENDDSPLEIYDVKSEIAISQEDDEPRFLVTWKTNKAAISKIIYSKSNGDKSKSVAEDGYGFEHSALIKNMDFSTIYVYKIKSVDRWGNKTSTEYFSVYTGEKNESIFDLIFNAVQDVFGWAMKK